MRTYIFRRPHWLLSLIVIVALFVVPAITTRADGPTTWTVSSSLHIARENHTATLLTNGMVLVTGGYNGSTALASTELYDPTNSTWMLTGSLHTARYGHTATLLTNGMVLVTGGISNSSVYLASAELFDPTSGTWTSTGSMSTARYLHTATLLTNGKVLVAGGGSVTTDLTSAEVYDPTSGTWMFTGSLNTARFDHTATLLQSGKVLVTGGYSNGYPVTAEMYDPLNGTWTFAGNLDTAREGHTATLLANGTVLVAGGFSSSGYLASAEMYDPVSSTWTFTGSMSTARWHHTATLLTNGTVLITGGISNNNVYLASAEVYNPASSTWTPTSSMHTSRYYHTATLLSNTTVLITGGVSSSSGSSYLASTELYGPSSGRLLSIAPVSGAIFQTIRITGTAFGPAETVNLYWDTTDTTLNYTGLTGANGTFSTSRAVPPLPAGSHTLRAVGQSSNLTAHALFTIEPEFYLHPSSGPIGTVVRTTGYGYGAQEVVNLFWDTPDQRLGTTTTDALGSFAAQHAVTFKVPVGVTRGTHTVFAIGQTTHVVDSNPFIVP